MASLVFDFGEPDVGDEGAEESADKPIERFHPVATIPLQRPAKLVVGGREYLCIARTVSEIGLSLRLFHALPSPGELAAGLHIEFDTGTRHGIAPLWHSGRELACVFPRPVDIAPLLEPAPGTPPRRQPRIRIDHAATLYAARVKSPVIVRDISQRGAAIDTAAWLADDEPVRLESSVLPVVHARVRWRRPPRYGLAFDRTFKLGDLARLCTLL